MTEIIEPLPPAQPTRFFERVDWQAFGVTTLIAFLIYLFTLAPEVTLAYSGIYAASALYPGASIPPGHPVWIVYGWLFTKLIPFSNIAWRLGVSSAFAAAMTCGMIALIVSRVGFLAVENIPRFKSLSPRDRNAIRIVCGGVAGLGFGCDGSLWPKAVVVDTWPLSLMLLALSICLLTRWFFVPPQRYPIYLAIFIAGLMVVESRALIPSAFALLLLLVLGERKLGRDVLLFMSICLWILIWHPFEETQLIFYGELYRYAGFITITAILTTLAGLGLCWATRKVFTEWKVLLSGPLLFLAAFGACFLTAVFSMTGPPVNWRYPRTVEGFLPELSRGQYCGTLPVFDLPSLPQKWSIYFKVAMENFGLVYLIVAVIPIFCIWECSSPVRRWLVGMLVIWLITNFLMLAVLDPTGPDRTTITVDAPYFAATHLLLAILAGIGFVLLAVLFAKSTVRNETETPILKEPPPIQP